MTHSEYILQHVSKGDLLAQLAEECAELAQAALKLRRTLGESTCRGASMRGRLNRDWRCWTSYPTEEQRMGGKVE